MNALPSASFSMSYTTKMISPLQVRPKIAGRPVERLVVSNSISSNADSTSAGDNPCSAMCSTFPPGSSIHKNILATRLTFLPHESRFASRVHWGNEPNDEDLAHHEPKARG